MISSVVRSLRDEPRAAAPPARVWRDWALVAVLLLTAVLEGILRTDVPWRPVALVLAVALVFPLLWRRTHPLAVVAVVFGAVIVLNLVTLIDGPATSVGLYTMIYVLLLPYALLRWGSGREVIDRVADHRGRRRARDRERLQRLRRGGSRLRVPHVPRSSRRPGPLLDDVADSRDRPGEAARARAARAGAARHRGAPRLGDGRPGAGGTGGRAVGPGSGARCAPGHRGGRLPYPRRDADHGGRAARSRGCRPRPAERRCRHRAARAQRRRRAPGAGAPHRRPRRAQPGGRGSHLPHRPGVSDERAAARTQRHPDRRAGRRRGGRRTADGPRRRRAGPRVQRRCRATASSG